MAGASQGKHLSEASAVRVTGLDTLLCSPPTAPVPHPASWVHLVRPPVPGCMARDLMESPLPQPDCTLSLCRKRRLGPPDRLLSQRTTPHSVHSDRPVTQSIAASACLYAVRWSDPMGICSPKLNFDHFHWSCLPHIEKIPKPFHVQHSDSIRPFIFFFFNITACL